MTRLPPVFCDSQSFPIDRASIRRAPALAMDAKLQPVTRDRDSYPISGALCPPRRAARPTTIATDSTPEPKGNPMDDDQREIVLKYLCSKLDPDSQTELQSLLGGEPQDDLAEDALKGRLGLTMDRLPPRMRRMAAARTAQPRDESGFYGRYPDAKGIKA